MRFSCGSNRRLRRIKYFRVCLEVNQEKAGTATAEE